MSSGNHPGGADRPAPGGKPLKSFKDLARSRGIEPKAEAAPRDDKPFTFDGSLDTDAASDSESLRHGTARERIASRPRAFGPMAHGPACYRDDGSEEMQILASFRVRTVFPRDVREETAHLPANPTPEDLVGRLDLRDTTIFTIDGDDAKDFDDAISIEPLEKGAWRVGVHIADVAHYVRPGTALDAEALARATSVYVADQVVPMLPEELSNGLCSLVQGHDRLTYSVLMTFDAAGRRTEASVHKSVIHSRRRTTYRGVQELLDRAGTPEAQGLEFLRVPLEQFKAWTLIQQKLRDQKGSLRMPSRERKFVFDERHEVVKVVDYPRYFSMTLIEETALAANQAVGDLFRERGLPTIYRVHPEKSPDEIEAVAKQLEEFGLHVPTKERLTGRDIGRLIRAARKKPNAEALIQRILGLIERAVYEVHDHEDVATHFGLARKAYLHFTSPIRRYPDLLVHRWLWSVESRPGEARTELQAEALLADLNEIASHCSAQAEVAEMCETAIGDLKVCQYMHPHVGLKLDAKVARVSHAGLELHLTAFNVNGFLPAKKIGDRVEVSGPTLQIRQGKKRLSFTEGYPIAVRLVDVDFLRLQLMFELA
ncbi:MAG: RNB domain-containing ribonuclease [Planctomycetes bacterium]|nr:RNB domain-containing ribonuclease [Planctomycetota bacterium]